MLFHAQAEQPHPEVCATTHRPRMRCRSTLMSTSPMLSSEPNIYGHQMRHAPTTQGHNRANTRHTHKDTRTEKRPSTHTEFVAVHRDPTPVGQTCSSFNFSHLLHPWNQIRSAAFLCAAPEPPSPFPSHACRCGPGRLAFSGESSGVRRLLTSTRLGPRRAQQSRQPHDACRTPDTATGGLVGSGQTERTCLIDRRKRTTQTAPCLWSLAAVRAPLLMQSRAASGVPCWGRALVCTFWMGVRLGLMESRH